MKSPETTASYQCLHEELSVETVLTSWIGGLGYLGLSWEELGRREGTYAEYPGRVDNGEIPFDFRFVGFVECPCGFLKTKPRNQDQTSIRKRSDPPFSANVLDAEYLARGAASLPFSSHSLTGRSFQSASETVMGSVEKLRMAAQEEENTMRCTEELVGIKQVRCDSSAGFEQRGERPNIPILQSAGQYSYNAFHGGLDELCS